MTDATYARCWVAYVGCFRAYSPAKVTYLTNARGLAAYAVRLHVCYAYSCLPLTVRERKGGVRVKGLWDRGRVEEVVGHSPEEGKRQDPNPETQTLKS